MRSLLLLSLLLAGAAWSSPARAGNSVVNLSHYDLMRPDFAAMRAEGVRAIIHESSYPPSTQDPYYATRQQEAVAAGMFWGAYHYANASNPQRQVEQFLRVVETSWRKAPPGGRPNEILLVLDFEKNGHYPGGTMRPDQAAEFVQEVHRRTGHYPGLYGSEYRLQSVLSEKNSRASDREILSHCWLWVANYHHPPGPVPPWSHWTMWQYTGDGVCDLPRSSYPKSVANIRKAERNIFRGDLDELREFWKSHGWNPGEER
ncbi:MAG: glycoside hydrolase family 25 protein [Chthoniobacterales bacterium]